MINDSATPGKPAVLEEFLKSKDAVFSICVGYTRNFHEAEELVQDVFCRALERGDGLRSAEHFRRWLFVITRNLCRDHARARQRHRRLMNRDLPREGDGNDPEAGLVRAERGRALKYALERLPERYRAVLILHEYGELSYQGIADVLGIRIGTVMSRLSRARRTAARLAQSFLEDKHEHQE
jgi:RNA polymerase sigma-70 factor, ECF subfamily